MRFNFEGSDYFIDFEYRLSLDSLEDSALHNKLSITPNTKVDYKSPNITICRIAKNNYKNIILEGKAQRAAMDNPVKEVGRKIALTRALSPNKGAKNLNAVQWDKDFRTAAWNCYFERKEH